VTYESFPDLRSSRLQQDWISKGESGGETIVTFLAWDQGQCNQMGEKLGMAIWEKSKKLA
jgi:hypothetical protein